MPQTPNANELLAPLIKKYVANLPAQKDELDRFLNHLENKTFSAEDKEDLTLLVHSLSGSGATYGFPDISEKSSAIELFINENPKTLTDGVITLILQLIDTLSEIVVVDRDSQATSDADDELKEQTRADLPLILIADDDEMIRVMLVEFLRDQARTIQCETAKEALKLMKAHHPDLVLLDDKMPGGQRGVELLEQIQNQPKISTIPVMMITANKSSKEVLRGLMAGAVDYIIKPLEPEQVISRVKERLKRRRDSILIADDDVTTRSILKQKLLGTGCRILMAEDGTQALDAIQEHKPSLVILDRMMPGMDGLAILNKMREVPETKDIPVIFLTAKHKEEDIIDGLKLGAVDYIVKPFNPAVIVSRCERILKINEKS